MILWPSFSCLGAWVGWLVGLTYNRVSVTSHGRRGHERQGELQMHDDAGGGPQTPRGTRREGQA